MGKPVESERAILFDGREIGGLRKQPRIVFDLLNEAARTNKLVLGPNLTSAIYGPSFDPSNRTQKGAMNHAVTKLKRLLPEDLVIVTEYPEDEVNTAEVLYGLKYRPQEKQAELLREIPLQSEVERRVLLEEEVQGLVRQTQQGNSRAFGRIFEEYRDRVCTYALYRTGSPEVADDVTQEVFTSAFRTIGTYRPGDKPLTSWLFAIAHNKIISHHRKHRPEVYLGEITDLKDPIADDLHESLTERISVNGSLQEALTQLSPIQQKIILLRFGEDLSHEDIAKIMGKSNTAVRVQLTRALSKLRNLMVDVR